MSIHVFSESSASSWRLLCYMLKRTYGHVPVLPSQHIVHPAAEDDFVICQVKLF